MLCILQRAEMGIRVCFSSDMDEEPQSTDQSTDRKEGLREGGRIMRAGKEGRKRGSKARESVQEIQIRTWKQFSCVLS